MRFWAKNVVYEHNSSYFCIAQIVKNRRFMLEEKAGQLAGQVWEFLNANGETDEKAIMKGLKLRKGKDFYLAIGWLLREGKLNVTEEEKDVLVSLK